MSEELQKIVAMLKSKGKMSFMEAAPETQIIEFQKANNVQLPEEFKEWLSFSDGGECYLPAGIQIYGICHKPVIDVNCSDRPDDNYVVIGMLSSGDPILFQKGQDKVSIYNQEAGCIEDDEVYSNFYSFLKDLDNILGIED